MLAGGFAWYERSRPPARMVALVAALAALAVAGRLVFAPIPNVVATTDIVLITGYAVGPAPGFAVGALAAVVSNLWLGQGPWTPWQMAGWGLVGLGGAALAVLTGRRLGRVGLAAACGLAGLAYGALLDLSVMVGYGGSSRSTATWRSPPEGSRSTSPTRWATSPWRWPRGRRWCGWSRATGAGSSSPGAMRRRRAPGARRGAAAAGGVALLLAVIAVGAIAGPAGPGPGRGRRLGQALARAGCRTRTAASASLRARPRTRR